MSTSYNDGVRAERRRIVEWLRIQGEDDQRLFALTVAAKKIEAQPIEEPDAPPQQGEWLLSIFTDAKPTGTETFLKLLSKTMEDLRKGVIDEMEAFYATREHLAELLDLYDKPKDGPAETPPPVALASEHIAPVHPRPSRYVMLASIEDAIVNAARRGDGSCVLALAQARALL